MTQTFKKVALFAVLTGVANVVVAEPTAAEKAQAVFKQYVNLHTKEGLGVNAVAVVLNTLAHGHFNPAGGEYGKSLAADYWTEMRFRQVMQEASRKTIEAIEKKDVSDKSTDYTEDAEVSADDVKKAAVAAADTDEGLVEITEASVEDVLAEEVAKAEAKAEADVKAKKLTEKEAEAIDAAKKEAKAAVEAKKDTFKAREKKTVAEQRAARKDAAEKADYKAKPKVTRAEKQAKELAQARKDAKYDARTTKQKLQALSSLVTEALIVTSAVNSVLATMAQDAAEDVEEADADVEAAAAA